MSEYTHTHIYIYIHTHLHTPEISWELHMYGSSCRFGISDEIFDFALKNSFRRNSIIGDQFGRNWLLNVCPNKVRKNVGGIGRDFGGITRTQLWLQISTAHENPISAESKIVGNFLFSAEIIESGDSCAEMKFRQKFPKCINALTYICHIYFQIVCLKLIETMSE